MTGMSKTKFGPDETLSRAQFVVVMYRLAGEPAVNSEQKFPDVDPSCWYGAAVTWATQNGIITGYTDHTFKPAAPVTREQMAAIIYRYAKYKGTAGSASGSLSAYADANKVSDWAKDAFAWASGCGVITGKSGKYLDPQGKATRAECATIIKRMKTANVG